MLSLSRRGTQQMVNASRHSADKRESNGESEQYIVKHKKGPKKEEELLAFAQKKLLRRRKTSA